MAEKLPKPPMISDSDLRWSQWFDRLWRKVVGKVITTGDAAATIGAAETYHGVTALTAGRNLTLPSANDLRDGDQVVVQDESGAAGTHNITITRVGSDTINGGTSVSISTNYGRRVLIKRGFGKWFSA